LVNAFYMGKPCCFHDGLAQLFMIVWPSYFAKYEKMGLADFYPDNDWPTQLFGSDRCPPFFDYPGPTVQLAKRYKVPIDNPFPDIAPELAKLMPIGVRVLRFCHPHEGQQFVPMYLRILSCGTEIEDQALVPVRLSQELDCPLEQRVPSGTEIMVKREPDARVKGQGE